MTARFVTGDGTRFRIAALAAGTRARPADAALVEVPGMTSANLTRGAGDATTKTFESGMATDGRVTTTSWGFAIGGNWSAGEAGYRILATQWKAGREVWAERLLPGDTEWRGGPCSVMDLPEPAPADGIITWSSTLTGRGLLVETPVVTGP